MKFKRIIALGAALLLTASTLPACGKKEETKITNVFKESSLKLPEQYSNNSHFNINRIFSAGDIIYAESYFYDEKTYESRQFLLPINLDGTTGEEIPLDMNKNTDTGGSYLQSMSFSEDGSLWAAVSVYSYDEETGYQNYSELRHYSEPGAEDYEKIEIVPEEGEEFYLDYMVASADGSLVVGSWQGIKIVDPNGNIKDVELDASQSINTLQRLGDKVYVSIYSYDEVEGKSSNKFVEIDTAACKLGDEHTVPSNMMYNMVPGKGYDYYYNDGNSIWAGNLDSEEHIEILNFINSDINGNNIYNILPLSADKFFATGYDDVNYNQYCMMLERVPDEQVAQKELITLATPRLDYDLRRSVINFNKSNDKYRIIVSDYSIYATDDDYNAGASRLSTDLTAGKLPDIIQITDALPYDSYVSKKLFTDLYELMDADESFNRADYLENIFKACETDGKLYSLIPRFRMMTFVGKTENLGGIKHWTVQEFMQYMKAHPDIQAFDYDFNRTRFLEYLLEFSRDNYIDRETGECRFDSDDFKAMLEFASTLTTDDFWGDFNYDEVGPEFWDEYDRRYSEDRVLLCQQYFFNLTNSYKNLVSYTFQGEVTLIGFPCDEGNGAGIIPSFELAITNRSKHKDGAWEFLKSFVSEDAQMPTKLEWGYDYGSGIPIMKSAIEKQLEIAMTPPENSTNSGIDGGIAVLPAPKVTEETAAAETESTETTEPVDADGDGIIDEPTDAVTEDTTEDTEIDEPIVEPIVPVYPTYRDNTLTKEQADDIRAMVEGATQILRTDEKLNAIISEEAESYFSGQKTLDVVVGIIQNRAETYISESR